MTKMLKKVLKSGGINNAFTRSVRGKQKKSARKMQHAKRPSLRATFAQALRRGDSFLFWALMMVLANQYKQQEAEVMSPAI